MEDSKSTSNKAIDVRIEDGKWHEIDLDLIELKLACCDCGLVHKYLFKVINKKKIKFALIRDEEETERVRREYGYND